ncbi:hypothetical protein M378DRAFT_11772 [Amanita muscaria Koide BX008]|uniref:Uncharacterized protein n=1 Tax=Amanita muscaria (strain Koide BX008) TaxID=946122 RepID=A0A0C2X455_AMAMK|nr:hypothetical protein M378DRAFT_11772 [Amanita muscaria Koide BX008]
MECTTAKPAIKPNQPPIPEEILLNHFPEKHSKFLKHKESLKTHIRTCSDNYHYIKADSKGELPEKAKFILLKTWYDKYWYFVDKLQDYVEEYYKECAQMIKLGIYETKRRSETVAATSKVRRNEHHLISSHNRLSDSQCALKPKSSTLKSSHKVSSSLPKTATDASDIEQPEYSWTKGFDHALETLRQCLLKSERASHKRSHHVQPRTKPNHPVDVEMAQRRPSSHQSLTRPQRKVERAHSEPHAITQEGCKPSTEVVSHQEQRPKPAPSSQSDWKQTAAQTSKNLDSPESRFNSCKNLSQETLSCAADVEIATPSRCTLTQVHAETDNPKLDCHSLTRKDSNPLHHSEIESVKTHMIMRAHGDTASMLSRVQLSEVALRPRKDESENNPPTPCGHIHDDRLSPHAWKPPDEEIGRFQRSIAVNGIVDTMSVETHSPRNNSESKSTSQTLHNYMSNDQRDLHERKPPDKNVSRSQRPCVNDDSADSTSVKKHSPFETEVHIVPPHTTRSLQELLESHKELEWRAHSKIEPRMQCARKPPDKLVSRGFRPETLKFLKTGVQHLSNSLLPAFGSVLHRRERLAPCLKPNG